VYQPRNRRIFFILQWLNREVQRLNLRYAFFQSQQFQDQGFPIKIPLEFASLIDKDNPNDPLLKQVIPSIKFLMCGIFSIPLMSCASFSSLKLKGSPPLNITSLISYYLHLLDKVSGAEHFLVSDEDARRLHRALQKQLSV
jgi:L-lysine 2,3-aminomutase